MNHVAVHLRYRSKLKQKARGRYGSQMQDGDCYGNAGTQEGWRETRRSGFGGVLHYLFRRVKERAKGDRLAGYVN